MTAERARDIESEAARWVMRLDAAGRTPELMADLENWLGDDRRRRGAFLQAEAVWAALDPAALHRDGDGWRYEHRHRVAMSRRWLLGAGGGAVAASLIAGWFGIHARKRYDTAVGEVRRIPLADGSVASINTASIVDVSLQKQERRVRVEKGEAWFQVARDKARPFVVEAGPVRVRAVGTAFAVRCRDNGADILVTEGLVEAWVSGAEGHRVRIGAGGTAYIANDSSIKTGPPEPAEVDRALAWRSGRIDLAGEPLAIAAAEFNRYNARKIEIADPHLSREQFFGVFRVDDPEGFANAVRESLGAPVILDDPAVIRIGKGE